MLLTTVNNNVLIVVNILLPLFDLDLDTISEETETCRKQPVKRGQGRSCQQEITNSIIDNRAIIILALGIIIMFIKHKVRELGSAAAQLSCNHATTLCGSVNVVSIVDS